MIRTLLERAGSEPAEAAQVARSPGGREPPGPRQPRHRDDSALRPQHHERDHASEHGTLRGAGRRGGDAVRRQPGIRPAGRRGDDGAADRAGARARRGDGVVAQRPSPRPNRHLRRDGGGGGARLHPLRERHRPPRRSSRPTAAARPGSAPTPSASGYPAPRATSRFSSTWRRASSHWARSGSHSTRASRSPRGRWWMRKASRRPIRR